MGETLVHPVRDRPIVEQGGEHFAHRLEHLVDSAHVEIGFLLAGKRRFWQILGGRR